MFIYVGKYTSELELAAQQYYSALGLVSSRPMVLGDRLWLFNGSFPQHPHPLPGGGNNTNGCNTPSGSMFPHPNPNQLVNLSSHSHHHHFGSENGMQFPLHHPLSPPGHENNNNGPSSTTDLIGIGRRQSPNDL